MAGRGSDDARPPRKLGRGLSEVSHVFFSGAKPAQGPKPPAVERGSRGPGPWSESGAEEERRSMDALRGLTADGPRLTGASSPRAIRRLAAEPSGEENPWLPRSAYVSITSGEGVRGKTLLATSVAYGLQARGRKVALVNADPGRPDRRDVVGGRPVGPVDVGDDAAWFPMVDAMVGPGSEAATLEALEAAARDAQNVIIDTSPWLEASVAIWRIATLSIVVAEPSAERMKASYVTVKRIHSARPNARIGLVLNSVRSYAQGEDCFRKLAEVARKFLKINLRNYGCVLRDAAVNEAYERAIPLVKAFPDSKAAKCIDAITGLIVMDQSAIARRRREVIFPECVLRKDRLQALRS